MSRASVAEVDLVGSGSLDAVCLRAANALDRSVVLAEEHAERLRRNGQPQLVGIELERAKRAREAAERGRAFASRGH